MYVGIVRVDFAAAFVDGQEYGFDAGSGLCHQTCCTCRRNGETGNVTTAVFLHFLIQFGVGLAQTVDERVVLLTFAVVNFKSTTLFCHYHRRAVGTQRYCLMYLFGEFGRFFSAVTQSQCCKHIAFGGDSHTGTATLTAFLIYLLPQYAFSMFHVFAFRIGINLGHDAFYLFQLQIDDIVHDALGQCNVLLEEVEIEVSVRLERIDYIGI